MSVYIKYGVLSGGVYSYTFELSNQDVDQGTIACDASCIECLDETPNGCLICSN